MLETIDTRETEFVQQAWERRCVYLAQYIELGYPTHLAETQARSEVLRATGIDLTIYYGSPVINSREEFVYPSRDLSMMYDLEHDGSALDRLLERYGYQWKTSHGVWVLTPCAIEERAGF